MWKKSLIESIRNFRLSFKISLFLGGFIFISIFIYLTVYLRQYQVYEEKLVGQETMATLHSIDVSLQTIIDNADNYSKMILSDETVQKQVEVGAIVSDFSRQQILTNRIYSMMQFSENIETVYLVDKDGESLAVGGNRHLTKEVFEKYKDLKKAYGTAQLVVEKRGKENVLLLIRSLNNLSSFTSMGLIALQLNGDKLEKVLVKDVLSGKDQIAIVNVSGDLLFSKGKVQEEVGLKKTIRQVEKSQGELLEIKKREGKNYYLSGIKNHERGWKIIRYSFLSGEHDFVKLVQFNILLIVVLGIVILGVSVMAANTLIKPVQILLDSMGQAERGDLQEIGQKSSIREFQYLFIGYDRMVKEIKNLLKQAIEKQKRIRIVEMNELQELMKPHFLYNTLDTIEALILSGDEKNSIRLVEKLGNFYRKSVSGGKEFLSIKEEVQISIDYADILKIRFGESFKFDVRLQEDCMDYKIPKLTIQPLVENAFQHGIRAKEGYGYIQVNINSEEGYLHISVLDNGGGFSDELLEEILGKGVLQDKKSLGLRGTIQRLHLLYGESFFYDIRKKDMLEIHLYIRKDKAREIEYENNQGNSRR